ncbi:MAG: hypothetical protein IJE68_02190 [Clostridia bacterium]|nr:hypothetical protein [Clostridia bacterium]
MATLQLKVQESRFVEHNGVEVRTFSPTYVEGNGWKCYIDDNGNIVCIAEQDYNKIRYKCKIELKKGYVKLLLKKGSMYPEVLKSYKLEVWPVDGVIGLPGGHISSSRPYFREEKFQGFLEEHGLSAVRHGEASVIYTLKEKLRKGEVTYREEIEASDGRTELIFNDIHKRENDEEGTFTILRKVEVTNATWVIKKVVSGTKINRILYTTENPREITNLPKK